MGVNIFHIPMNDMLTLIHAWIDELNACNPDMVWKLPVIASPNTLDDNPEEYIAIVGNFIDIRISLYLELTQFLEKELLHTDKVSDDYIVKKAMLRQTMQLIWMLTFNEIHQVPQGKDVAKSHIH